MITYAGDVDSQLDNGGTVYHIDDTAQRRGYCDIIDVVGASDLEDGRSHGCMVITGSICLSRTLREWRAIYACAPNIRRTDTRPSRRLAQIQAVQAYYGYDQGDTYRTKHQAGLSHLLDRLAFA